MMGTFLASTLLSAAVTLRTCQEIESNEYSNRPASTCMQDIPDAELMRSILTVLSMTPDLDDEEIALQIGAIPFDVSRVLRDMEKKGLVVRQ